jgi:hypothetical protein
MDITNPKLLYLKGFLFIVCGGMAAGTILIEHPSWKLAALLALTVWCFARAYYFAFYVIQHYVDPKYRFAGLYDFLKYALSRKSDPRSEMDE